MHAISLICIKNLISAISSLLFICPRNYKLRNMFAVTINISSLEAAGLQVEEHTWRCKTSHQNC